MRCHVGTVWRGRQTPGRAWRGDGCTCAHNLRTIYRACSPRSACRPVVSRPHAGRAVEVAHRRKSKHAPLATPTPNVYRPAVIGSSSSAARMARAARWRKCSTLLPLAWAALCPEACGGVERGALGAFVGVATALWTKSRSASTVRGPVCSATRSPWRSSSSVGYPTIPAKRLSSSSPLSLH